MSWHEFYIQGNGHGEIPSRETSTPATFPPLALPPPSFVYNSFISCTDSLIEFAILECVLHYPALLPAFPPSLLFPAVPS